MHRWIGTAVVYALTVGAAAANIAVSDSMRLKDKNGKT